MIRSLTLLTTSSLPVLGLLMVSVSVASADAPAITAFTPSGDMTWASPLWHGRPSADDADLRAYFDADMARVLDVGTDEESDELDSDEVAESIPTPAAVEPIVLTKTTCVSLGKANHGYLINGVPLPTTKHILSRPKKNYGTPESVAAILGAAAAVQAKFPNSPALAVGDLSRNGGGSFRPHKSHQSGRDADIAYYIKNEAPKRLSRARPSTLDVPRSWAYMQHFLDNDLVKYIFVDYRLQKPLYEYARDVAKLSPERLEAVFQYPRGRRNRTGIIRHAKGHDDHMHVRFHSPRAVAAVGPYLEKYGTDALKPLPVYTKVRRGNTLGRIARRHKVSVKQLRKWNRLKRGSTLRIGQKLVVGHRRPRFPKPS